MRRHGLVDGTPPLDQQATKPGELFAVAFFDTGGELAIHEPARSAVLRDSYRQDHAVRAHPSRASGATPP